MFSGNSLTGEFIMGTLPVIEDSAEKIQELMYMFPRCWQFETSRKKDGRKVLKGLFCETNPQYSDLSWRELAILIA